MQLCYGTRAYNRYRFERRPVHRPPLRVITFWLAAVAASGGLAPPADPIPIYRESRRLMGTLCEIQVADARPELARRAAARALEAMARVDRLLSLYDPTSELSRLNREAARHPVRVSRELFAFLQRCRQAVQATGGTFDPAVGALVRAWGFFDGRPALPRPADLALARARSGFEKVVLDGTTRTVSYAVAGLEIDPGGIGKGYAVDRALETLVDAGVRSALVSAGGSTIAAIGRPPHKGFWTVAVASPSPPWEVRATVPLQDRALSTSGLAYRSVQVGSRRYAHIFDPRTGVPVEGMCQVTVVAATATESEVFAKAAFVLTRDQLVALVGERRDLHVLRLEGACGPDAVVWRTPWSADVFREGPSPPRPHPEPTASSRPPGS
jgi:thiamine biosynthesis lipoprotein